MEAVKLVPFVYGSFLAFTWRNLQKIRRRIAELRAEIRNLEGPPPPPKYETGEIITQTRLLS